MEQMYQSSLYRFEVGVPSKGTNSHGLVDVTLANRALLALKAMMALRRPFDMKHKLATSAAYLSLLPRNKTRRVIA
jgi:hypothetical protein